MLHPWKSGLALGFRFLPRSAEGTVQNSPDCSFKLFLSLSEGREQCGVICLFVPRNMLSLLLGSVLCFVFVFLTFCWLTLLLSSLGNSNGKLTSSRTMMYILGGSYDGVNVFWKTVAPLQGYRIWLVCISYSVVKVTRRTGWEVTCSDYSYEESRWAWGWDKNPGGAQTG